MCVRFVPGRGERCASGLYRGGGETCVRFVPGRGVGEGTRSGASAAMVMTRQTSTWAPTTAPNLRTMAREGGAVRTRAAVRWGSA
jgi:hypothetical protein